MAPVVAYVMADCQVLGMAASAVTARNDVLECCGLRENMFAAKPTRDHAVHLPGDGSVYFVANQGQGAHESGGCSFNDFALRVHLMNEHTRHTDQPDTRSHESQDFVGGEEEDEPEQD